MTRLTAKCEDGEGYFLQCSLTCIDMNCTFCEHDSDALNKLGEYEDAEEQGLLVHLPCKVGDTVYKIARRCIDVSGYRMEWERETIVESVRFTVGMMDAFGKSVFLTREEAEARIGHHETAEK